MPVQGKASNERGAGGSRRGGGGGAARRAREQHSRQAPNIPVWPTLAEASAAGETEQDAVWMLHTIDHLPDPDSVLREVFTMLRPGGVLIITNPNGACLARRVLGELWEWWTPPAHLCLLSPRGAPLTPG